MTATAITGKRQNEAREAGLRMAVDGGEVHVAHLAAAGAIQTEPAIAGGQRHGDGGRPIM